MNLSALFIHRPVGTTLIAIGLALAGILAFRLLPVSSLPQTEIPIIMVQAQLAGASPEIMASSIATPLENSFSRIAGVTTMTSNSTLGNTKIILQFDLSRSTDGAASDVQSAIDASLNELPNTMNSQPTYKKVNPADAPIMVIALTSKTYKVQEMYDMAYTTLQQRILQIEGVGQIIVAGSSLPAIRIEANPNKLNQYGISLTQMSELITNNHVNLAKGRFGNDKARYEIITNDQLFKVEEYSSLIIKNDNQNIIRISDVANVKQSVQDTNNSGNLNGERAVLLVIFKEPSANVVEINHNIRQSFAAFKKLIPAGVDITQVMDRSTTIRASLEDVERTLILSIIFVLIVVYVFLGNIRSTFIPGVALVLSILGTFGVMWALGFSLNILSLMAITISTGFVVDDAIVVLENISRYIEEGIKPKEAALKGAAEIGFTVTSISISLIAVFIPLLLMGGIVGKLFREFAVSLSVAILISLIVSLALTPMMCAYILKPNNHHQNDSFFLRIINRAKNGYSYSLNWSLNHPKIIMFVFIITIILNIFLYVIIPKGLFPQQDTGRIITTVITDQNSSFKRLNSTFADLVNLIKQDPAVRNVLGYISSGNVNTGTIFIDLKELKDRKISADLIVNRLRKKLANIAEATIYMQSAQDIVIGGRQSNAQFQYTISTTSIEDANKYAPIIQAELAKIPGIVDINSDQGNHGLQSFIKIDYDKAAAFGVTVESIDQTLYAAFGQQTTAIMYKPNNQYYVVLTLRPEFTESPDMLKNIYVASKQNSLIQLSSIASFSNNSSLLSVNHQGLFPSATLSFNLLPNIHLGDAVSLINSRLSKLQLPITVQGSFYGTAQAFQDSLKSQPWLILAALVTVYIVLGILYESLRHPLTILSTLPPAGIGALLALLITNTDLSIIAVIGIILLIGIVKKNAIMMIDFVLEIKKEQKITSREAIHQAAVLRFRPIMMTTMAALLGALPMAISNGFGSEMQKPLGIAIIGGLIFSQALTLYTTPIIYLAIENFRKDNKEKLI